MNIREALQAYGYVVTIAWRNIDEKATCNKKFTEEMCRIFQSNARTYGNH